MGRYCFFSTGVEYKFALAEQESSEILLFGGTPEYANGQFSHRWTAADKPEIEAALRELEFQFCLEPVDLCAYPLSPKGTRELLGGIREVCPAYRLGTAILHQLGYRCPLTCHYEI